MKIPTAAESADVIEHIEAELAIARKLSATACDCAAALVELRSLAFDFASRQSVHVLTADKLAESPRDEVERARLASLVARSFPKTTPEERTSNGRAL